MANNPPPDSATVVVLGCKVHGDRPSESLQSRIDAAAMYLQAHPQAVAILCGGKGDDENISEALAMQRALAERGIQQQRLLLEDASTNTRENLQNAASMIRQRGLSRRVAIVTEGFHQLRAAMEATGAGLSPYSVSSATPWYMFAASCTREWLALAHKLTLG